MLRDRTVEQPHETPLPTLVSDERRSDPRLLELAAHHSSNRNTSTGSGDTVDRGTFESWYRESVDDVYGYLARRVGASVAEDLAAETFIRAWTGRRGYKELRGTPRAWIFGIATNLLRDHSRRERSQLRAFARMSASIPNCTEGVGESLDHVLERLDLESIWPAVAAALVNLSDGERDVLWLFSLGNLSYGEISETLGIPVGTVRSRLSRSRARLIRVLGNDVERLKVSA